MTTSPADLDLRLLRFRSRRDEYPHALASALIDAGRPKDALEVIHLGLLDDEGDGALRTLEGRAFYDQGDLQEAQAALLRAAKSNPQDKEPYRWLAQVLIERGDSVRALQVLDKALSIDPNDAALRRAHARASRLAGSASAAPAREQPAARRPSQPSPQRELRADVFLRESHGDLSIAEARPSAPAEIRGLPFDEELERDDESPTRAVELSEELRSALRAERPSRPSRPMFPPTSVDEDDEGSEATSIMPAAEELELLRQGGQLGYQPDEAEDDDDTRIGRSLPPLAAPGRAEPPEEVLGLLRAQGVFETERPGAAPATWASGKEVTVAGLRITRPLLVAWAVGIVVVASGYFGFQAWLGQRRAEAARLVASARERVLDGEHASLVQAGKLLGEARALDPKSPEALSLQLLAQAARLLDEGPRELAPLRETLAQARSAGVAAPLRDALEVLLLPAEQRESRLGALLTSADGEAARSVGALYVSGRLAVRAGLREAARERFLRAASLEPEFALAHLASGELARADGRLEQAQAEIERALGKDRKQLRAELWLLVLTARAGEGAELLRKLEPLLRRSKDAGEGDRLLAHTARAYAQLAIGDTAQAKQALQQASTYHTEEPELLAFLSEQALRAGSHTIAYRAARAASEAGGGATRYQALVAAALLQQGDGNAALSALASLGEGHGALALARAGAALLTEAREPLERAKKELASYRASPAGKDDLEASSLLMRVDLRLGANVESLMPAARALLARAPDSAPVQLAFAEASIAAEQPAAAIAALDTALRLAPGSADAHFLRGRAQRLLGHENEARQSFERAIAIAPNHLEARRALGRILLDGGEYDAALALFRELLGASARSAEFGVIEALLGQRALEQAAQHLEQLPEPLKAQDRAELLRARLALARNQPADAATLLGPLVSEDAESRSAEALVLHAEALMASDRAELAAASFDAALALDPTHPDALIGRALVALRQGRSEPGGLLERAQTALTLRMRPPRRRAELMMAMGLSQLARNQLDDARAQLGRAVTLPDAPAEAFFWYGEALARSRAQGAREQYARYLELAPNGTYALRAKRGVGAQ